MPQPIDAGRAEGSASAAGLAEALFAPRAVALIGASDDPGKIAARPLLFLRKHRYPGAIYPINPRRATVLGERAYASLAEAPGPVDHAYILVGTPAVEAAVEACAEARVKVATVLASGFAEAGAEGAARQRRLAAIAARAGLRLLGPNSIGVVNTHLGMPLSASAVFNSDALLTGRFTVISQSGGGIGTLVSRGAPRGIGFAKLISVGNEADLSVGEIGAALAGDPDTDVFLLFLETIRQPAEIARFAALAARAGKPVAAYKLGRSEVGQELAVSHTGAMVGPDAAVDAFFRRHGMIRVDHLETLLELPSLLVGRKPPSGTPRAVGVVTTTGGGAATMVDRLGVLGVEVAAPSADTLARLGAAAVAAQPGRLVDLTLAGARYEVMRAALDALLSAPEFAVVAAVVGSSALFQPDLVIKPIIDCAREGKPLAAFIVPQADHALRLLAENGIAAFRTPEACADGIAAYLAWRAPSAEAAAAAPETLGRAAALVSEAPGAVLDERRSLAVFGALGLVCAPSVVIDPESGPSDGLPFGFPVAAKVLSADITHKTEAGGVALAIASADALEETIAALRAAARRHRSSVGIEGILVQKMEHGIAEVLLGYRRDPQVGPVVSVGMGGTLAELYRDFAVRLAPVTVAEAAEMIAEVRGLAVIAGYRGSPRGDAEALARAIADFSQLAVLPGGTILEAEINPLIVKKAGAGVVAVDGVVRRDLVD